MDGKRAASRDDRRAARHRFRSVLGQPGLHVPRERGLPDRGGESRVRPHAVAARRIDGSPAADRRGPDGKPRRGRGRHRLPGGRSLDRGVRGRERGAPRSPGNDGNRDRPGGGRVPVARRSRGDGGRRAPGRAGGAREAALRLFPSGAAPRGVDSLATSGGGPRSIRTVRRRGRGPSGSLGRLRGGARGGGDGAHELLPHRPVVRRHGARARRGRRHDQARRAGLPHGTRVSPLPVRLLPRDLSPGDQRPPGAGVRGPPAVRGVARSGRGRRLRLLGDRRRPRGLDDSLPAAPVLAADGARPRDPRGLVAPRRTRSGGRRSPSGPGGVSRCARGAGGGPDRLLLPARRAHPATDGDGGGEGASSCFAPFRST